MPARRLIVLLCVTMAANTCSIGAFPALLPELGTVAGLADWQLGAVVGAFGLARMVSNIPAGLFITHHLARALALAPLFLIGGALLLGTGDGFASLLLGRAVMGVGHTLGMLGAVTAVLRHAERRLASALNALEMSAMLGILAGAGLLRVLPRDWSWNEALLAACAPMLASAAMVPAVVRALPPAAGGPLFARSAGPAAAPAGAAPALAGLVTVAGATLALAYASVEQLVVPLRGSREFGLDRGGIAGLLMTAQAVDIVALLPLGALADRLGPSRVLGGVLVVFAGAVMLIGGGPLPAVVAGCALFGLSMAGWMLPLGILRSVTPPAQVAWRTALYRVAVDGGLFLGPVVSGALAARHVALLPLLAAVVLAGLGLTFLARRPLTAPSR